MGQVVSIKLTVIFFRRPQAYNNYLKYMCIVLLARYLLGNLQAIVSDGK